ncbi:hypothetical protein ACHHYP_13204 [Achlya hypogyna]|uniref:Secreted protein n=1 Tax=Achlya hypogyna TaxID=1202772 RepID=A0A0A7CPA5_ACHHY|nr:secreted protein [Achlya hypogyna]OQR96860.1 hypothetical protein ACHHYP_13204 [Achlya hypogyna]
MKLLVVASAVASTSAAVAAPCTLTDLAPVTKYLAGQMSYPACTKAGGFAFNDFLSTATVPTAADTAAFLSSLDCNDVYQRFQKTPGPSCSLWGQNYADISQLSFQALVAIKGASSPTTAPTTAPNVTTAIPLPTLLNVTTLPVTTPVATTKAPRTTAPPSSGSMAGNMTEEPVITTMSPAPTFPTIKKTTPATTPASSAVSAAVAASAVAVAAAQLLL